MSHIHSIQMPIPPSVNSLWRISGRRMYRSKKYMEWIADCTAHIKYIKQPMIDYPFDIEIVVGRPSKRRMDIDNRAKAVMDILEHLSIFKDDCLANKITMQWSNQIKHCEVKIWKSNLDSSL